MSFDFFLGLIILAFGFLTLGARVFGWNSLFSKKDAMEERFGAKAGNIIHVIAYTALPLFVGTNLIISNSGTILQKLGQHEIMAHDFQEQRETTRWVWNDLSKKYDLSKSRVLELQFVPEKSSADWDEFERRLKASGYRVDRYEDGSTMEASVGPIMLSFEAIWKHELSTSEIAIECGFRPDGWGFLNG